MIVKETSTYDDAFEYVGFWIRLGACLIDSLLLMSIMAPLLYLFDGQQYPYPQGLTEDPYSLLLNYGLPLIATVLFWVYHSATPGKMVFSVKVMDAKTGSSPTAKQSLIRYLGYYICILSLGVGFIWVLWDAKKQGWHDKMAKTIVVREKERVTQ